MSNVSQTMTLRVPPALRKKLEKMAADKRWSLNTAAIVCIESGLDLPENKADVRRIRP